VGQNSTSIHIIEAEDILNFPDLAGVLLEGDGDALWLAAQALADRPGRAVSMQAIGAETFAAGHNYNLAGLRDERAIAINTAAAGGNAGLVSMA
jgi:RHH-type proline utilization regulon transcriptional repressor/proline dehydrogenase/delta 1-pyrroline-5-carboxylate dehydrogenase